MNYDSALQRGRQDAHKHEEYPGVVGDDNGNPYGPRSTYWVRFPLGTDTNGDITYSEARPVRYDGTSGVIAKGGIEVMVRRDPYDDVETITRVVPDYWSRSGIDSRIVNQAEPFSQFTDARNFIRLLCRPVGSTSGSPSTKVTVREDPFFVDWFGDWSTYAGTIAAADKIDLDSYIPAADEHRLIVIFFDRLINAPLVTASTAKALSTDIDSTDYDEAFAALPHNEYTALVALELADDQPGIDVNNVLEDLRTWLPAPPMMGFPNPIPADKAYLLRETHQMLMFNLVVEGTLTLEGSLTVL